MVKIPSLDELKKMGSDLIDATKSINLKEVVDHFKSGAATPPMAEKNKELFQRIRATLQELSKPHANQEILIKQLEQQLSELEKIMGSMSTIQSTSEDKK